MQASWLVSFIYYDVFKVRLNRGVYQNIILLPNNVVWVYCVVCVYWSPDAYLDFVNNASVNIHINIFRDIFSSLGYIYLVVNVMNPVVILCWLFWRMTDGFPKSLHNLTFTPEVFEGSNFSTSLLIFVIICLIFLKIL